ncbi:hypothetical protein [Clostridium estertheticum]|nr:hypothetical protein [Clostridium estertheticum]MCB2339266.1 hypothetical protein [Clostridium estertheticum]
MQDIVIRSYGEEILNAESTIDNVPLYKRSKSNIDNKIYLGSGLDYENWN